MLASLLLLLAAPVLVQHDQHAGHAAPAAVPAPIPAGARRELDALARAVARYRDVRAAEADGWEPSPLGKEDSPLMGEHWIRKGAREYKPGEPLDFTEPSNLQYAWIGGRRELVGASYVVRIAPGDPLPDGFSGDADRWHVHDVERAIRAATEDRPLLRWLADAWIDRDYRSKGDNRSRLAMVHAWVSTPSPDGVFSTGNRAIPYLRVGLPASFADGGTEAAALGVNLAAPNGCASALGGELWIANVDRKRKRSLESACRVVAERVRAAVATRDARTVNAAGEAAWRELEGAKAATLTPDQRRRILSITEHDPMHADGREDPAGHDHMH